MMVQATSMMDAIPIHFYGDDMLVLLKCMPLFDCDNEDQEDEDTSDDDEERGFQSSSYLFF